MTPVYSQIQTMFGNQLQHDHIAIRSFKSLGGIDQAAEPFTKSGEYTLGGNLDIPQKHLTAKWYYTQHGELAKYAPRIFISQIDEQKLTPYSQDIIAKYTLPTHPTPVSKHEYEKLANESEYAAWTLIHRNNINHVAVLVASNYTLQTFLTEIEKKGITLNTSGGKIKTSKDGLLHQASTMSDKINYLFKNKENAEIPAYFMEFVQRDFYDKEKTQKREGFESNNALHIFDSTNINTLEHRVTHKKD